MPKLENIMVNTRELLDTLRQSRKLKEDIIHDMNSIVEKSKNIKIHLDSNYNNDDDVDPTSGKYKISMETAQTFGKILDMYIQIGNKSDDVKIGQEENLEAFVEDMSQRLNFLNNTIRKLAALLDIMLNVKESLDNNVPSGNCQGDNSLIDSE